MEDSFEDALKQQIENEHTRIRETKEKGQEIPSRGDYTTYAVSRLEKNIKDLKHKRVLYKKYFRKFGKRVGDAEYLVLPAGFSEYTPNAGDMFEQHKLQKESHPRTFAIWKWGGEKWDEMSENIAAVSPDVALSEYLDEEGRDRSKVAYFSRRLKL